MKIAMLGPPASARGPLPKLMPLLVEGLARLGCEVELLPWGGRSDREGLVTKLHGRLHDVAAARRAVVAGGFPVVVVNTAHDWWTLGRDYALLRRLPRRAVAVLQFHGSQSGRLLAPGSWTFKEATRAVVSRADGILLLSNDERLEWERFQPAVPKYVVRNPAPLLPELSEGEREPGPGTKTILCVARLIESKGVLDLVRALPLVREAVPCRLVLAGDGPERGRLLDLATEIGVRDAVTLAGYAAGEELTRLYRSADVFALPTTHYEGFPTVILEAMAAGLPIVTTAARGVKDHLENGKHALLVPARDPAALAAALVQVLGDPALRQRLGEANLQKVADFDADSVAEEYLLALRAIVDCAEKSR